MKEIRFPEVVDLAEVLEPGAGDPARQLMIMTSPITHTLQGNFKAVPKPRLAELISQMIYGAERSPLRERYLLEIVFREDGTALLMVRYQFIIGSRWICLVPHEQARAFLESCRN